METSAITASPKGASPPPNTAAIMVGATMPPVLHGVAGQAGI
jgi:hypothetical protein